MSQDAATQHPDTPTTPIILVKSGTGETLKLGHITCRIIEDGSNSGMGFLGNGQQETQLTNDLHGRSPHRSRRVIVPSHTTGHPPHWHQMYDEIFVVTAGTVRFRGTNGTVDAKPGDCVVVPIGAPHAFSNAGEEEARFVNTFNPSYYVNYFRLLAAMYADKPYLDEETVLETMHPFGTLVAHGL